MSIRTTVVGSYPKVTDSGTDNLPGVIDRWQRQLVSDAQLEEAIQKAIRRVIQEQEQAGIDLVTDGQIRWEDLMHPVVRSAKGLTRGTLKRFFDNNVYYRRLEHQNGVQWQKGSVAEEFRFASQQTRKPVKAALPGPLTLVHSTEPKPGQSPEKLLSLYADLLRKEVEALAAAGAKEIQIDEPAFGPGEPLLNQAVEAVNRIFQGIKAHRWVACYFHDVTSILPALSKLQVEVLHLDLVSTPEKDPDKVWDFLKAGSWRGEISLGLIDARNTKLESPDDLKRRIAEFASVIPANRLWLSPNCGLEFLPHASTLKKLEVLRQTATLSF